MLHEQPHLLPLAAEPFDLTETSFPTVDGLRCVRVERIATPRRSRRDTVEARIRPIMWKSGMRVFAGAT